jgi:hypothetical protein
MDYAGYLKSAHWHAVRRAAIERAGYRCQLCAGKRDLQVHHNSYENCGHELERDLVVLCDGCHAGHSAAMPRPPAEIPEGVDFGAWYPAGRAGEIVRALESERDPERARELLAEKIAVDGRVRQRGAA